MSESVETSFGWRCLSFLVPPFPPRALRRRRGRGGSRTMNDFDSFDTNRDGSLSFAVRPPPTRARLRDPPVVRGPFHRLGRTNETRRDARNGRRDVRSRASAPPRLPDPTLAARRSSLSRARRRSARACAGAASRSPARSSPRCSTSWTRTRTPACPAPSSSASASRGARRSRRCSKTSTATRTGSSRARASPSAGSTRAVSTARARRRRRRGLGERAPRAPRARQPGCAGRAAGCDATRIVNCGDERAKSARKRPRIQQSRDPFTRKCE